MTIKYNYKSKFLSVIKILGVVVLFHPIIFKHIVTHIPETAIPVPNDASLVFLIFLLVYLMPILAWLFCFSLFSHLPLEMVADENTLTVKVPLRETAISYSDIESINLNHEFRTAELRGEHDHYNEILTITDINKKKYVYCRPINLDQNAIAMNPDSLKKQFENSDFSQLKRYIEKHIYINI